MAVSAWRQCKVSFSPVEKKEQSVAVSRDMVALSLTRRELCHPRLPSPKSWGIISSSAAHIRLTCWGSAASAPSLAALCPSIFPVPFPPSCCASSLDRSLLRPPVLSFLLFLSASPHTLASHPSRHPCSLKTFFFSLPPPSFPSSARSYYFAFIRPLPPSLPLSGSLYPAPALLFFLITDSLFLSIPLPDLPPPNPSYPIPSLS